ncbi:hypothetical protein ACH4SP_11960 [Streptomyces sp. NPDC021093]|uniref:hypothetical protein n=1 Tax=Streptomyces sp. NPDC021093 TaxID=3365112 RepID=UPI0037B953FB
MRTLKVRLVDLLGNPRGTYRLTVIPLLGTSTVSMDSGASYSDVLLDTGESRAEEDMQIRIQSTAPPATVIGRGIVHVRWAGEDTPRAHTSGDFPPHLEVIEDAPAALSIRVRRES